MYRETLLPNAPTLPHNSDLPHLLEFVAESVTFSCSNIHFGLQLLTTFLDPGNFSNFQFWAFQDPGTWKLEFLGKHQYRTPRPRLTTPHVVEYSAESVTKIWSTGHFGLPL